MAIPSCIDSVIGEVVKECVSVVSGVVSSGLPDSGQVVASACIEPAGGETVKENGSPLSAVALENAPDERVASCVLYRISDTWHFLHVLILPVVRP